MAKGKSKSDGTSIKLSTARRIEAALVEDIAAGQIAAGERMDETRIAQRFGASRTPVREALNRLVAMGILVSGDKRGLHVISYSKEQLAQIFEAMFQIELVCAHLAAQRLTLLTRMQIEKAQAECVAAARSGDKKRYSRANEAFHATIYEATSNPFIADLAADFRRRTGPFRARKFQKKDDLIASAESHKILLDSIFSSDTGKAVTGMREHMTASIIQVLSVH